MNPISRLRLPPDCREVAAVLQSFLDGELPVEQTPKVAEHVEHCNRCGIEADVYVRVKESLARLRTAPDGDAMTRLRAYADGLTAHQD